MARSLTTIQNSDRIVAIRGKESQRRNAAEAAALAWMAEAEGRGVAEAIAHMEQSVLQAPALSHGWCCHLDAPHYISSVIINTKYKGLLNDSAAYG